MDVYSGSMPPWKPVSKQSATNPLSVPSVCVYQTDGMTPKHNVKYPTASGAEGTAVLMQSASHKDVLTPSSSVKNTKTKTRNIQYG